ncbi:hypothetical protein KIN20_016689 [Parelaphostrongylus tenuis]|uniref:Glycosyltransferase family 92 protein n=1 Tax=Parelaphostrongylus tenuis TaxID=148309 RepID=A0AAD5N1N4_PARTN|nr:hypothetical protein KIN20_016689 [Parelaphostrongylus tenuis]
MDLSAATYYFSACLAPLYGAELKWLILSEFLEHHKIQGVEYFYIYLNEIDEYSRILLDDYVRSGEAEVVILRDPYERDSELWQLPQLQECLIRARGHSNWVAMIDLDGRLTPTEYHGTLADYLKSISDPTIAELTFRQQLVLTNETESEKYTNESQVAELMPTWRYHNTSQLLPSEHNTMYIVNPKKAVIANIHGIDLFYDGYRRYHLKDDEAVVR